MKMKYLMVLSLLMVSCDDLDMIQKAELEHGLSCTSLNEMQHQQVQCFHSSMMRNDSGYAMCYERAISSPIETYQLNGYIHADEYRQVNTEIIIQCAISRGNLPGSNQSVNFTTVNALQSCQICIDNT